MSKALPRQLFGGAPVLVDRDAESRQRFNVRVKTSAALDIAQALENLSRN